MIVAEHNIKDIVATIPEIRINDDISSSPSFHWGDEKELARYLLAKDEKEVYPLIWLLPTSDNYKNLGKELEKSCEFIIATREISKDMFNDKRYINSFDVVLNPITDRLIHGLKVSTISDIQGLDWEIIKFPNYSKNDKNGTIDLWDALKLIIKVRFTNNNNCLKPINYGKL